MNTIVSKFGGSSVADEFCFQRVLKIIQSRPQRQYIILSAPGKRHRGDQKITDLLTEAHIHLSAGKDASEILAIIRKRFSDIISNLSIDIDPDELFSGLEDFLCQSRDHAASRGEYLCARIFAAYANMPFVDAVELIHFDNDGHLNGEQTRDSIASLASILPSAIIPGFYGSLPDGGVKTFPRGGSDITGALVAAALRAAVYENWTDVDGLMSIDPSLSPDAAQHCAASYHQMEQIALAGAQVLHPYCLEPVRKAGIATILRNTFHPENTGTYISNETNGPVCCVCAKSGHTAIAYDARADACESASDSFQGQYTDANNRIWLAVPAGKAKGRPIDIVSVFGLPASIREEVSAKINPIAELHTQHCSKYLIPTESSQDAQRMLHAQLRASASRSPSDSCERLHPNL